MSDRARKAVQKAAALRYTEELPAPLVVATGRGRAADTITRIARDYGVTIVQDADLAESLIGLDIGSLIPEELYEVVAAVLAFARNLGGTVVRPRGGTVARPRGGAVARPRDRRA